MKTFLEISLEIQRLLEELENMEESKEYYEKRNKVVDLMVLQRNMIDKHF